MHFLPCFAVDFVSVWFLSFGLGQGFQISTQNFKIHELCKFMQIYAKKNDTVLLYFPANLLHLFLFCLSDSVLVVVPSRPTQNSEIHYLFNLSNLPKTSMKSAASLFCSGFSFCLYYLIGFGCSFQISKKNSEFLFFLEGSEIVKLK